MYIADALVAEGNLEIQTALKSLCMDRNSVSKAQAKIQLGVDQKAALTSRLNGLEERKNQLPHPKKTKT